MSSRNRNILIVVVVLALGVLARLVFPISAPTVSVRAEAPFAALPGITNSMIVLTFIDIFLIVLAYLATRKMQLVPSGLQNVMELVLETMFDFFSSINKKYTPKAFPILATLFLVVIFSNWSGLLPGFGSIGTCQHGEHAEGDIRLALKDPYAGILPSPFAAAAEEGKSKYFGCQPGEHIIEIFRAPSADLNMTLALALIVVGYVEYMGFSALGLGYLGKFFNFKNGPIGVVVGLFELISEIARIPAFMFRLFGNIFAGEVLLIVMIFLLPLALPLPFYLFEVFVGFMQAFIFSVLTIAFIGLAVESHDSHGEAHH